MNGQPVKNEQMPRPDAKNAPVGRPPKSGRAKVDPALLKLLRVAMLILAAMITLTGLLIMILPTFRVGSVEVEGNSYHTAEEILAAAEIEIGQEILAIDKEAVNYRIWDQCRYVNEISIVTSFNKVRIIVTEMENVMYTEYEGMYYSMDRDFRVIEESKDKSSFEPFLCVTLPEIASLSVGGTVKFEKAEVDRAYIAELIDTLDEKGKLDQVSSLDFSKKYSVSYILSDTCRVELGKVADMGVKLKLVEEILARKGGLDAALSVVDVSDLAKPTYRVLASTELLFAGKN